ncbi:hypothetical protein DFJ43DRAFT_1078436 [Lentinula guzmanii]|uniref:G domain-containing protein n=1 Tax=Lentinula guzmanii TaxID=2804957 RepID=A0AA38JLD6_9AGAR|nr:hypothetical protein DFJ43DRAFT_1078436 [Lentinula guzmanii]
MKIGRGLESCTSEVQLSPFFRLNGRNVCLIDTPGFDDTNRPDSEILKDIAYYICEAYQQHIQLAGVVFIHRISDSRVTGVTRRNMKMFQQLCGTDAMKNVVIVTNMWGHVDKADGELREAELRTKSIFLEEAIKNGACIIRHDNSANSARKIISELLKNDPVTLQIQREMLDQRMDVIDTAAGAELNRELMEQAKKYQKQLEELKKESDETHKNDVKAMQELKEEAEELARNKAKAEAEIEELRRNHTQLKEEGRGGT